VSPKSLLGWAEFEFTAAHFILCPAGIHSIWSDRSRLSLHRSRN